MADVLIVCVREDELQAKALADMFERAGFTVGGAPSNDGALRSVGAAVIVWSQAAIRSRPFLDAAQRAIDAEKAVVASLIDPPPPHTVGNAPSFALNGWTGDPEDPSLDPLFFAVDRMVSSQRAAVGAAPAHPAQDRFQEPPSLRPPPVYAPPAPPQRARPNPPPPPRLDQQRFEPRPDPRQAAPPARDNSNAEAEHWRVIRDSRNPNDFMDFIAKWGADGSFSELAELRLKQLTGPGAPPAPPTNLREAARAAEPRRRPDPPPPAARRPDPPPPIRLETRRPEPLPRIVEPPRRDPPPAYARDYRPPMDGPPKSGGGLMRALVLALLLGGGALAAGLYYGGGADTLLAGNDSPGAPDESSDELPPVGPAELGVGGEEHAEEPVELASNEPPATAAPRREQAQRETQRPPRQQPPRNQQTSAPAPAEEAVPAPQTSWTNSNGGNNATASPYTQYGPANLDPPAGATTQAPVQVAANDPQAARPPAAAARAGTVRWAQRPSARRIAELYPERASRNGTGGRAELACTVRADLTLACTVASETPPSMGFGRAALSASTSYRVQPTLSDGAAAAGTRTRIAITFVAQEGAN